MGVTTRPFVHSHGCQPCAWGTSEAERGREGHGSAASLGGLSLHTRKHRESPGSGTLDSWGKRPGPEHQPEASKSTRVGETTVWEATVWEATTWEATAWETIMWEATVWEPQCGRPPCGRPPCGRPPRGRPGSQALGRERAQETPTSEREICQAAPGAGSCLEAWLDL